VSGLSCAFVFTNASTTNAQRLVPVSSRAPASSKVQEPLPGGNGDVRNIKPLLGPNSDFNLQKSRPQDKGGQIEEILPRGGNPVGNGVVPGQSADSDVRPYDPRNYGAGGDSVGRGGDMVDTRGTEIIRQRYPDGKVQVMRYVIQDEEGNYFNQGPWKLLNRQGQVLAEGQFDQGYLTGSWQRWHNKESDGLFSSEPFQQYQGPFLSVAYFNKGKLHGSWIVFDPSRRKIFELGYQNGKRDGIAIWWYPNGMKMRQMGFRDGTLHGELVEWNQQGRIQRRERYVKGQQLVTKTENWAANQKRSEDSFLGPRLEVKSVDDWWNGKPAEYTSIGNDIQHGPTLAWFRNGQPRKRGNYVRGMRQGSFVWWYSNGQKQLAGAFADDQRTGNWVWWHENGMKAISGQYKDGKNIGVWRWWNENGKLVRESDLDKVPEEIEYDLPNPDLEDATLRNTKNGTAPNQPRNSNPPNKTPVKKGGPPAIAPGTIIPDIDPPVGGSKITDEEMSILSGIDGD